MINHRQIRAEARLLARNASVPAVAMTALMMGILVVMNQLVSILLDRSGGTGSFDIFFQILTFLVSLVLQSGFLLYCMEVRRGEAVPWSRLFDGFSFAGKLILLYLLEFLLVYLWSLLFLIPGAIAFYRYRFAVYNLCENPGIGVLEAINMSKAQTSGYKMSLFAMDLSFAGWVILGELPYLWSMERLMMEQPLPLSDGAMTLLCNLFLGVVALFWMARHRLCMLACLEICKHTSGVGAGRGGPGGPLPLDGDGPAHP